MARELTDIQRRILQFIRDRIAREHCPPSSREICAHFGFRSVNAATGHLRALRRKGCVRTVKGLARNIRVCSPDEDQGIPILGQAPAGTPLAASEIPVERLALDRLFSGESLFAVKVRGDSMRDSGILDGDLAVVQSQSDAPDGAVVLAYLDGDVTIKRLRRRGGGYRLLPDNPAYKPIDVNANTVGFRIGGRVIGVVRVM